MATNQIRGNTQILSDTITNTQINSAAAIDTSKLADGADFVQRDGSVTFTADQPMGGFKITGLGAPSANGDAATKAYVDSLTSGLQVKASVKVASTAVIASFSGEQTIDGVLTSTSRVLVKDQGTPSQNGIYVTASGAWARAADYAIGLSAAGTFVFVEEGTVNADSGWVCTSDVGSDVVGTDPLAYTQFSSAGVITAGDGMTQTGNTFNVIGGDGITANANDIEVAVSDFAGTGLENDGSNNLRIAAAAAGDGLTGGAGSALAVSVSAIAGTNLEDDGSNNLRIAASAAGAGLTGGAASALAVGAGTGITVNANDVAVDTATILAKADDIRNEVPSGTINGSNTAFTLANTPNDVTKVTLYVNGIRQRYTTDFSVSGVTITLTTAPVTGDNLITDYLK